MEIRCWCRWVFALIFMHFKQVEGLPAQIPEMLSPLIACSLIVCSLPAEQEVRVLLGGRETWTPIAVSWQSTLTSLGRSSLQGDNCYCLLTHLAVLQRCPLGHVTDAKKTKIFFFFFRFVLGMQETICVRTRKKPFMCPTPLQDWVSQKISVKVSDQAVTIWSLPAAT